MNERTNGMQKPFKKRLTHADAKSEWIGKRKQKWDKSNRKNQKKDWSDTQMKLKWNSKANAKL